MECASLPEPAFRSQPDERLVALTRAGQPRAFEEIVRRYRPSLVRFAGRFVSDGHAEDVVQEALVRSHRALLGGESEIHLRSWLYRIVHNGAISDLRATRPHDELDETIDGVPQPPDIFERREELRGVVKRLKALPASQRQALVASELEGASHDQIAKALGTTPGGVSQLIFRARTALRSAGAWLFPLPLLRLIPKLSGASTGGAGSAGVAGGAGAAVAGSAGAKLGSTMAAAVLLVGSGAALNGERAPASKGDEGGGRHERADSSSGTAAGSADHQPVSASASSAPATSAADSGHSGSADSPAAAGSSDAVREASVSGSGAEAGGGADDAEGDAGSTAPSSPADSPNADQPPPSGSTHGSTPPPSGTQPPPGGSYSGGYRSGAESGTSGGYTRPPRMYASGDTYTAPPPPPPDGEMSLDGSQPPPPPDGSGDGSHH